MPSENQVVSVVIPAFDKPVELERALSSVVLQSYRPIEVLIGDDASPQDLSTTVARFPENNDPGLSVSFVRHVKNVGHYWNLAGLIRRASGSFLVMLDHDDHFVDVDFIQRAVKSLMLSTKVGFYAANIISDNAIRPWVPISYGQEIILTGQIYLERFLFSAYGPVKTSTVLRLDYLRRLGYDNHYIDREVAKRLEIYPDEGFVSLALLCSNHDVIVTGRIVAVRGELDDSLSRRREWAISQNEKLFFTHYNLFLDFRSRAQELPAKVMVVNMLWRYPIRNFRLGFLSYYAFHPRIFFLMALSFVVYWTRWLGVTPRRLLADRLSRMMARLVRILLR